VKAFSISTLTTELPHPFSVSIFFEALGISAMQAADLKGVQHGAFVRIAGAVIARQRPETASGFIFISD
jgi:error-prone DNA polymerase